MLTFPPDFWPVLWASFGAGALLTVMLALLIAAFPAARYPLGHRRQPARTPAAPARENAAGHRTPHAAKAA